ncbi:MAG: AtpZ/AtpI family protein, partial [Helicobacter sp.]|nr:AtpZ/AtpI family protein [Helicobacter sp.]
MDDSKPKYRDLIVGLNDLTLGISLVIAVLIGVGLGYGLRWLFGIDWLLWVGVFFGVAAAILNVY